MKMIEGRYYKDAEGKVRGPAKIWDSEVEHPFELPALDGEQEGSFLYRENGTSNYVPFLVSEVPEPILLKDCVAYVLRNGNIVTMEKDDGYFVGGWMHYNESGKCCYEGKSDHDKDYLNHRPDYDVVGKACSKTESLTLKLDASEVLPLIEQAQKAFDAEAEKLLYQLAEAQAETRAAKEALNVLHAEAEGYKAEVARKKLEVSALNLRVSDVRANLWRALSLVRRVNAENAELREKNEAYGYEVLRLNEDFHAALDSIGQSARERARINSHLRRDRNKLKAERARAALLRDRAKDAEDQLRMYSSGKIVARNASILFVVLAAAVAAGGFFL